MSSIASAAPTLATAEGESAHIVASGAAAPEQEPPPPTAATPAPKGRVGRQALVYGIGTILQRIVSFVMLPLYTSYLKPADYGVVSLVDIAFNVVAIVAGARLTAGIFRFYHKADTKAERDVVISTSMHLVTLAYAVVTALGIAFAGPLSTLIFSSNEHADVLRIAGVSFLLQGVLAVPLAWLTAIEEPTLFTVINLAKLFLQALLNYVFLAHFHLGVRSVFVSAVIAHGVVLVPLVWRQVRATGFGFSRTAAGQLLRFWWPLVFTQLALFVLTYGDRFFLQRAGGEATVGLYSLAYNFGFLLISMGFSPFARVWDSVRFQVAKHQEEQRDGPFSQAFIDVNVLMVTFGTGIMLFVQDFLRVMSKPEFHSAADMVPVILVAYLLQGWAMMQDVGVMVKERTGWNTVANVAGAVVALLGYVLLIPRWLGFGAAWATLASFAVRWVILYAASQRLWHIRYRWSPIARLLAFSALLSAAGFAFRTRLSIVPSIAAHAGLFLVYAVGVWHLGVIEDSTRQKVRGMVRRAVAAVA